MVKKRVRGQDLAQNISEEVILIGKIVTVNPSGKFVELLTTDDVKVNITLPEPIDGNAEGYMEVEGTVQSKGTLLASSSLVFPPELTANFSVPIYNEVLLLRTLLGDKKWRIDESSTFF